MCSVCDHVITNNNHVCVFVCRRWSSGERRSLRWAPLSLCDVTKRYSFMLISHFLVLFFRWWSQHDRHHGRWDSSMWGRKPRSDYSGWKFVVKDKNDDDDDGFVSCCSSAGRASDWGELRWVGLSLVTAVMFLTFSLFSCVDDSFREARWSRPALLWLVDSSKCLKDADLRDSLYERNSVRDQIWCLLFDRKYRL